MKTRVISSAVAILLLIVIVMLGEAAIGASVFILALIGLHEFYRAFETAGYNPVRPVGYISCIPLFFIGVLNHFTELDLERIAPNSYDRIALGLFILILVLFVSMIFSRGGIKPADVALTILGIVYVVFLFSFIILIRNMEYGYLYFWMVLIGAFVTDTCAYFTGVKTGKTKIIPAVSPKKSLEGSVGGIIGCTAAMLVYGLYVSGIAGNIPIYHFIIIGLLCGVISQLGDWAASAMKRSAGIKDFGRIMPGHGGVLDRFDSILFTAPTIYFYIVFFIK